MQASSELPVPNYENQSELDRYQQQQLTGSGNIPNLQPAYPADTSSQGTSPPYPVPETRHMQSQKDKKSQQFSLKAWLKREREQVRKGIESDSEPPPEPKPQNTRSFSRFKNSMMQKFTSGSNSKKQENSPKKSKDLKQTNTSPMKYDFDTPVTPYDVLRNNYQQQIPAEGQRADEHIPPRDPVSRDSIPRDHGTRELAPFPSVESDYNKSVSDQVISPIDDPDADDILNSDQNRYEQQNGVPPQMRSNTDDVKSRYKDSDLNNNSKFGAQERLNVPQTWQPRGDDTPYGRVHRDRTRNATKDSSAQQNSPDNYVGSGAESKCIVAQAAPTYKARVINNYENQGKFENPNVVRQQAEPANPGLYNEHDYSKRYLSSGEVNNDPRNPYSRFSVEHKRVRSSDDVLQDHRQPAFQNGPSRQNNSESSPYGQTNRMSKTPEKVATKPETPRKRAVLENRNYYTPGNRVPMNVQSIGSLIDKFDKCTNDDDVKPETMTSTPVASRKVPVVNGDVTEVSPPLPPRTPKKARRPEPSGNDSSVPDPRKTTSYSTPERQSYYTPESRMENSVINSHVSPPSVYSTPQGKFQPPNSQMNNFSPVSSNNHHPNSHFSPPSVHGDAYNDSRLNSHAYRDHVMTNPAHSNHTPVNQSEDVEDGYRARLRRAATNNHQSAFDRFSKSSSQYSGRPSFGSPYDTSTHPYGTPGSVKSPLHNNEEVSYMAI